MQADGSSHALTERLAAMRPRLHRYCARITGSVIDGEDVLQDALLRALEAGSDGRTFANLDGWIFRIAHHAALDHLRRRARSEARVSTEDVTQLGDPGAATDERVAVQASLAAFMRLPISQRSSVVLVDVLGHSVEEVSIITESSVPAVKAALHRGRARLRDLAAAADEAPLLSPEDRRLLRAYADHLNARDFDALREMLAEQVRLEVVGRTTLSGKAAVTTTYFGNYQQTNGWLCVPGVIEGRPGILVYDVADQLGRPRYFILTEWHEGQLVAARDFRHAEYAAESATMSPLAEDESAPAGA
jgi:RNA polymerase sigma-70 factor, ECF subfamily